MPHQIIDSGAFWRDEAFWYDSQHSEDFDGLADLACDRMHFLDKQLSDPLSYLNIEEYERVKKEQLWLSTVYCCWAVWHGSF